MQSVAVERESVSTDHTWDGAKNCNIKQVKVIFNVVTSNLLAACSIYCKDTSKSSFIHAVEGLAHRDGWSPSRNFLDTWPNDREFWESIWVGCEGRLDIFHWLKRILSTLHHEHKDFHRAQAALRDCIYFDNPTDVAQVKIAVKAGHLGPRKKFTNDAEFER
jgi:hypothetical protein